MRGKVSLRVQQLDVLCDTKTKDNVFVQLQVPVPARHADACVGNTHQLGLQTHVLEMAYGPKRAMLLSSLGHHTARSVPLAVLAVS